MSEHGTSQHATNAHDERARQTELEEDHPTSALAQLQRHAEYTKEAIGKLEELAGRYDEAARLKTFHLSSDRPAKTDDSKETSKSIGILNPNSVPIYLGIAGGRPLAANRAPAAPPNSLLVLPLAVEDIELGVDTADQGVLAAADAIVHVLRFKTAQPAFLGAL